MIDVIVPADAAGNVHADQAEFSDHPVQFIDRGLGILQRHDAARPDPAGIAPLRLRHLVVVHPRVVDAVGERNFGEERGERPERADELDLVPERVDMPE